MIVEYKKHSTSEQSSKIPEYGQGNKFPDHMESVQRYPRAEGMSHTDEARPRYAMPSNNMTPLECSQEEYPRSDVGQPYDPTVPMSRMGDTLDKRTR